MNLTLIHDGSNQPANTFNEHGELVATRRSPFTGRWHQVVLTASVQAYKDWCNGTLIQDALPDLSVDAREFLMTGISPEEWDLAFK